MLDCPGNMEMTKPPLESIYVRGVLGEATHQPNSETGFTKAQLVVGRISKPKGGMS